MTTVVTRLFADTKTAEQAVTALKLQNHPDDIIDMIAAGADAEAHMIAARVPEDSAATYAGALSKGRAMVVVRAPFMPAGAARNVIDTLKHFETINCGVDDENAYIREEPPENLMMDIKVDRTHRYWATWGTERPRGRVSDAFGVQTVYEGPGHKTWGTFAGPITYRDRFFGTFAGDPVISGTKFFGTFVGEPVLRGTRYFGSFLVPPLSKRRG